MGWRVNASYNQTPEPLAEWLYCRFSRDKWALITNHRSWLALSDEDQAWWAHEADAVTEAVHWGPKRSERIPK